MAEFKTAWLVGVTLDMPFNVLFNFFSLPQTAVLGFEYLSEDVCPVFSIFKCRSSKSIVNVCVSSHQHSGDR